MSRVARGASASLLLLQQQRQGRVITGGGGGTKDAIGDDGLDLFSRNRPSTTVTGGEEYDGQTVPVNLGKISAGQARLARSAMDDLLSSGDMGKHDYDWLLTPPGTPLVSSLEAWETHLPSATPRPSLSARSVSATKASRFSLPQQEIKQQARPARSTSTTRPSITSYTTSQLSSSSRNSILNTSTNSISSSGLSTPGNRSTSSSRTRPSLVASSRPTPSHSHTPTKTRPPAPASSGDRPRSLHGSRSLTPTPRSHIPATSNSNPCSITSAPSRSNYRPSTPTRRAPAQSSFPASARSPSVVQASTTSSRTTGPACRPSSPGPRIRPQLQPVVPPDFPVDAPPNLRTMVPERPASTGRTRPGLSLTVRSNSQSEAASAVTSNRRQSLSPVVVRGRASDNCPKQRVQSNGHHNQVQPEAQKHSLRENAVPKTAKMAVVADTAGFGRTISKKSLDMALRHMDIRQSMLGVRGASLFPQSIRTSTASKAANPARISEPKAPVSIRGSTRPSEGFRSSGDVTSSNTNGGATPKTGLRSHDGEFYVGGASEPGVYDSSRYNGILLRGDTGDMNWLHGVESRPDQSPVFDHRFEPLPEPFVLS